MNFNQPLIDWRWGGNRMDLAVRLATGKSVLHVGCVDDGIVSRETLHQKLGKVAGSLCGIDVVKWGTDETSPNEFFIWDFQLDGLSDAHFRRHECLNNLDLVVCTEVLEHLDSVGPFLMNLRSVKAKEYLFTVPNAFSIQHTNYIKSMTIFNNSSELVHPDHRCYFSPYTLENTLRKAGYNPITKTMVGFQKPENHGWIVFQAEGVAILAK